MIVVMPEKGLLFREAPPPKHFHEPHHELPRDSDSESNYLYHDTGKRRPALRERGVEIINHEALRCILEHMQNRVDADLLSILNN